ncbi:MAG TPA: FAD-dependent oxidoreductase [Bacteroidota bacterium]|nr:FAD-dependent oxidoreductase [Bacteroidota bacterium]
MKNRILVIGGLAAGPTAAAKAKRTNPNAEVMLFEQGEFISYGICEIPYYVSGVISDERNLQVYTPQRLEKEKGVKAHVLHRVEEILQAKKIVHVRNLVKDRVEEVRYDRLILATGSRPRKLGVAGEDGRNVFRIKGLDEAYALKRFIGQEHPRSALIIGGGYIGVEMADAFVHLGIPTTMLHRDELPMRGLEREARKAVLEQFKKHLVTFVPNANVLQFVQDTTGRVTEVVASSGRYTADIIVVCIGVEPNSELAKNAGIRCGVRGGILTDERQCTNIDTIYAAGDCCAVKNIVNRKWMYIPLATTAGKQGRVAGENAAGGSAIFKGVIRALAVKAFDIEVAQVGLSSKEAEECGFDCVNEHIVGGSRVGIYPGSKKVNIIALADRKSGRLVGANVFGEEGAVLRANTLGVAIQQRMTVDEIARLDLIYTPPYSPMWDPILITANQLKKRFD